MSYLTLESDKNTRKHNTQKGQEGPFPTDDHLATMKRKDSITKINMNINAKKDPQKNGQQKKKKNI